MYTFRIHIFHSHTSPKTSPQEIKKKQAPVVREEPVKALVREDPIDNKIIAPVKAVQGIAHLFKKP